MSWLVAYVTRGVIYAGRDQSRACGKRRLTGNPSIPEESDLRAYYRRTASRPGLKRVKLVYPGTLLRSSLFC
jgi:hypothetical protein